MASALVEKIQEATESLKRFFVDFAEWFDAKSGVKIETLSFVGKGSLEDTRACCARA